jgi:hypothetical protein
MAQVRNFACAGLDHDPASGASAGLRHILDSKHGGAVLAAHGIVLDGLADSQRIGVLGARKSIAATDYDHLIFFAQGHRILDSESGATIKMAHICSSAPRAVCMQA